MTSRQRNTISARPASGWCWAGLLTACLLTFQIHYLRVHLHAEAHHDGSLVAAASAHLHDHHDDHSQHHDHESHAPHCAADHKFQLLSKQASSSSMLVCLPERSQFVTSPEPRELYSTSERATRPAESPPDPASPRGPPVG